MSIINCFKIVSIKYLSMSDGFIDIEIIDNCGNIFEGMLRLRKKELGMEEKNGHSL